MKTSLLHLLVSHFAERVSGGSGLFSAAGNYFQSKPRRVVVLTPGLIPTTDIYLRGRVEKRFNGPAEYVNTLKMSPQAMKRRDDALVVVVRYAPLRWLYWLRQVRHQCAGIAFMMDDDMPRALRATELPLRYAMKTAWRYALTKRFLKHCCSEIWLSTPELAKRYPDVAARVWEPGYVYPASDCGDQRVYFYHATWAHRREMKWLLPVVQQVQKRLSDVWFEIMGNDRVRRWFRDIPRVRVVHPMTWENYRCYAPEARYQVGLAPCLNTDFNKGRSHSKLFDITAMGAVGIYSDSTPYTEKLSHGHTGLLCRNDQDAWVAAIMLLIEDQRLRQSIFQAARSWCQGYSV